MQSTFTVHYDGAITMAVTATVAAVKAMAAYRMQLDHEEKLARLRGDLSYERPKPPPLDPLIRRIERQRVVKMPTVGMLEPVRVQHGELALADRITEGARVHKVHLRLSTAQAQHLRTIMKREQLKSPAQAMDWLIYQDRIATTKTPNL